MVDAEHWEWKLCKRMSQDELLNECLGQFSNAQRAMENLAGMSYGVEVIKRYCKHLEEKVEKLEKKLEEMTRNEIAEGKGTIAQVL